MTVNYPAHAAHRDHMQCDVSSTESTLLVRVLKPYQGAGKDYLRKCETRAFPPGVVKWQRMSRMNEIAWLAEEKIS